MKRITLPFLAAVVIACQSSKADRTTGADSNPDPRNAPGYIVDSIFPMDQMLRRFRVGLGPAPERLEHGLSGKLELARSIMSAAAVSDTVTLRRLQLTKAEFAWLYFPFSDFARDPYELPPEVSWMQIAAQSDAGLTKLMRLITNTQATVDSIVCSPTPKAQEQNRLWEDCITWWKDQEGRESHYRVFGTIIERGGTMKLVSYANRL
jgi:hypothetical protein